MAKNKIIKNITLKLDELLCILGLMIYCYHTLWLYFLLNYYINIFHGTDFYNSCKYIFCYLAAQYFLNLDLQDNMKIQ